MSNEDEFEVPDEWGLSGQQELVIGSLMDEVGTYIPFYEICNALYPDGGPYVDGMPAPAKARVLVQRCRDIIGGLTEGKAKIETMRGKGWRITRKSRWLLLNAVGG